MGLNIKNPRTVALVRELAERTGTNQTSAIENAVRAQLESLEVRQGHRNAQARLTRAAAVLEDVDAHLTDTDRAAMRAAEGDLYDESGLPR